MKEDSLRTRQISQLRELERKLPYANQYQRSVMQKQIESLRAAIAKRGPLRKIQNFERKVESEENIHQVKPAIE